MLETAKPVKGTIKGYDEKYGSYERKVVMENFTVYITPKKDVKKN